MNSKKYTIIIPYHLDNEENRELLRRALLSVPFLNELISLVIVVPANMEVKDEELKSIIVPEADRISVVRSEKSDFASMVNKAVEGINTKYFSILEFDDMYSENKRGECILFDNIEKYEKYNPDVSVFIPLEDIHDARTGNFISFANESPWSSAFEQKFGFLNLELMDAYYNYTLTGSVFVTEDFKNIGMLKPSIKLFFWYEYIVRALKRKQKLFVIPKFGYVHNVNREGSLVDIYQKTMKKQEVDFWFEAAKTESVFKEDRGIEYVENL